MFVLVYLHIQLGMSFIWESNDQFSELSLSCHIFALLASSSPEILVLTIAIVYKLIQIHSDRVEKWFQCVGIRPVTGQIVPALIPQWGISDDELFLWQVLSSDAASIKIILSELQGNVELLERNTKLIHYLLKQAENVKTCSYFPLPLSIVLAIVLFLSLSYLFLAGLWECKKQKNAYCELWKTLTSLKPSVT